jgi:Major Facilitator Superfamily
VPTFSGGNIAGFAMSAGIFSAFLYLVLYLQDVLHYSPLQTGLRLLLLSGAVFVVSGISGRLSTSVPIRFLIGGGLALVGVGMTLMLGLNASSDWTHLIPGLIVSGVGLGFIEPPLASTAIGVVQPQRAGMASGINVTFRQVGISVGIALLGTIFASRLGAFVTVNTTGTPLHSQAGAIATAVRNDHINNLFQTLPRTQDGVLVHVLRASYASALNDIILVGAIMTFAAAVLCLVLIRKKDFVAQSWDGQGGAGGEGWDAGAWEQGGDSAGSWPQQASPAGSWPQEGPDGTPHVTGATGPGSSQPAG